MNKAKNYYIYPSKEQTEFTINVTSLALNLHWIETLRITGPTIGKMDFNNEKQKFGLFFS
jgi:hypothetical protein